MKHLNTNNRRYGIFSALAQRFTGFMIVTSILVACSNSACTLKSQGAETASVGNELGGDPRTGGPTAKASSALAAKSAKFNAPAGSDSQVNQVVVPRVQAGWQKVFAERGKELNAVEAWGLFSAGGWVDDGQLMVFVSQDGRADIEFVPPGGQAVVSKTAIGAADVQALRQKLAEIDQLDDHVTAAYDAVEYELVHLIPLADTGLGIKTRIMMVMPSKEKAPRHHSVLTALKDLRSSRVLK